MYTGGAAGHELCYQHGDRHIGSVSLRRWEEVSTLLSLLAAVVGGLALLAAIVVGVVLLLTGRKDDRRSGPGE